MRGYYYGCRMPALQPQTRKILMKKTKYTEEQIIEAVKQLEAGRAAKDLARELGVTDQALEFLDSEAREHFPESAYVLAPLHGQR